MNETLTHTQNNIELNSNVTVSGHVKIINGDTVIEGKNKITNALLLSLVNNLSANTNNGTVGGNYAWSLTNQYMLLGSDTTHTTDVSTAALTSPIGSPTKTSSMSYYYWQDGNNNYVQWNGTWNPGTVSGTVGEIGLFICLDDDSLNAAGGQCVVIGGKLAARYSVANSEMSSFSIDTTKPVIVIWTIKVVTDLVLLNKAAYNIANFISCTGMSSSANMPSFNWTSKSTYMVLGTNTSTNNTAGMTALVAPIGAGNGTLPNTQSFSTSNPSPGVYKITYNSTWNAGTVSGTCGEIGLYLYGSPTYVGTSPCNYYQGPYLYARLSVADSKFEAFSINTGAPLTISWVITFTWA
jgi:hypothetical protein